MNINMNENGSWMELHCPIPFRSWYVYWDKDIHYGDYEFKRRRVKVRYIKGEYKNPEYPYIGVIISCWSRDKSKVEEAMSEVDQRLKIIDESYVEFLNLWRGGVIEKLDEVERNEELGLWDM